MKCNPAQEAEAQAQAARWEEGRVERVAALEGQAAAAAAQLRGLGAGLQRAGGRLRAWLAGQEAALEQQRQRAASHSQAGTSGAGAESPAPRSNGAGGSRLQAAFVGGNGHASSSVNHQQQQCETRVAYEEAWEVGAWNGGGGGGKAGSAAALRKAPEEEQGALDAAQRALQALQTRLLREQGELGGVDAALQVRHLLRSSVPLVLCSSLPTFSAAPSQPFPELPPAQQLSPAMQSFPHARKLLHAHHDDEPVMGL